VCVNNLPKVALDSAAAGKFPVEMQGEIFHFELIKISLCLPGASIILGERSAIPYFIEIYKGGGKNPGSHNKKRELWSVDCQENH